MTRMTDLSEVFPELPLAPELVDKSQQKPWGRESA